MTLALGDSVVATAGEENMALTLTRVDALILFEGKDFKVLCCKACVAMLLTKIG